MHGVFGRARRSAASLYGTLRSPFWIYACGITIRTMAAAGIQFQEIYIIFLCVWCMVCRYKKKQQNIVFIFSRLRNATIKRWLTATTFAYGLYLIWKSLVVGYFQKEESLLKCIRWRDFCLLMVRKWCGCIVCLNTLVRRMTTNSRKKNIIYLLTGMSIQIRKII